MTNLASGKFTTFLVLMIISIFILIVTHAIVIPILLKVDKANNKVLNMFGLVNIFLIFRFPRRKLKNCPKNVKNS
jgi:hypothetical protein